MKSNYLSIASITIASMLVLSGLCVNGPLDLYVPSSLYTPLITVFALASLTLFGLGILYLAKVAGVWRQGRTWAPLFVFGVAFLAAGVVLRTVEFNVHLYGLWLVFTLAMASFSGLAIVFLVLVRISGLYSRRAGRQNHESRTA